MLSHLLCNDWPVLRIQTTLALGSRQNILFTTKAIKHKHKRDRKRSYSSSSEDSSDDSDSSESPTEAHDGKHKRSKHRKREGSREKKKSKHKKKKKKHKKKHKKKRRKSETESGEIGPVPSGSLPSGSLPSGSRTSVEVPKPKQDKVEVKRSLVPMTKEAWEKQRSQLHRVFDPETGRNRLVRGSGEIVEEIVSKERQKEINKQATASDSLFYRMKAESMARQYPS